MPHFTLKNGTAPIPEEMKSCAAVAAAACIRMRVYTAMIVFTNSYRGLVLPGTGEVPKGVSLDTDRKRYAYDSSSSPDKRWLP